MERKSRGMRSSRYQTPASLPPPDGVAGVITLDQVRPQPRHQNEYVDTPRTPLTHSSHKSGIVSAPLGGGVVQRDRVLLPNRVSSTPSIISQQPASISPPLKKDLNLLPLEVADNNSIICDQCGKCRCGACTNPRELPAKWLCGDKVKLSPETTIECCTCMCCVRALFYHCSKDDQDSDYECVADPCAGCDRPHCCKRWTCILTMSMCLPCLCLYWPARGCLKLCKVCYNKCRKKGCTCGEKTKSSRSSKTDSGSQCRGLLNDSDRESSFSTTWGNVLEYS